MAREPKRFKDDRHFDHAVWTYEETPSKDGKIPALVIDFATSKSLPENTSQPPAKVRASKAYIFFKRTLGQEDELGNKVARVPAENSEKPRETIEQVRIEGAGHVIKLARWLNTYDKQVNQPYLDLIPEELKRKAGIELSSRKRRLVQPPQLKDEAAPEPAPVVAAPPKVEPAEEKARPMYTRQMSFSGDPAWRKEPRSTQKSFTGEGWGGKERAKREDPQDKDGQSR